MYYSLKKDAKKIAKKSPSWRHRTTLSGCIFATKAYIDNPEKKLVKQQYLLCPHNMVNFGPLTAEIGPVVWGTPPNFNGFRILAALLHGTLVVGVSQTVALNRGRHLYSAGRPSRWALAHIHSSFWFLIFSAFGSVQHIKPFRCKMYGIILSRNSTKLSYFKENTVAFSFQNWDILLL